MRHLLGLSLAVTIASTLPAAEPPEVKLVSAKPGDPPVFEMTLRKETVARIKAANPSGKQWHGVLRIVVAGGKPEDMLARPPLAGTYTLTENGIRFEPQFPVVPGREYRAIVDDRLEGTLSIPKPPPGPRVAISAVYPSANRLPENTLRFYIHFTGEVARGDVYRHLKLVRDDGVEVKEPFLELAEELWSADGKRLTVLLHPGRVKRGLVPREQEGPILEEGRTYTLSVSGKWEDLEGRPVVAGFTKTFTAGPPDDEPVDPANWALVAPRAGSDAPLVVRLPKPLDHGMLGRVLWVTDAAGKVVPGTLTVGGGERVLTFAPQGRWARGEYKLMTDARLEDVCGNRVGEPFEVDVFGPVTGKIEAKTAERRFTVR